jgi:shikimate kinase
VKLPGTRRSFEELGGRDDDSPRRRYPRIALVGPCGAGKSTLGDRLRALGYDCREPAQEHSGVPDMWRRFVRPDVLIYLDATAETITRRLHRNDWTDGYLAEQHRRLEHARAHCHLYLPTDDLTPEQVQEEVLALLGGLKEPSPRRNHDA